jgi:hypothetical protein
MKMNTATKKQPARRMKPWRSSRHAAASWGGQGSVSGHHGGRLFGRP